MELDPAAVLFAHRGAHWCSSQWWGEGNSSRCLPQLLAEELLAKQAELHEFDHVLNQYEDGKIGKVACVSLLLNIDRRGFAARVERN